MGILNSMLNKFLNKHFNFLILIILASTIRLLLTPIPAFKIDMDAWIAWTYRLFDLGLASFYSPDVWTNYTPGYLYFLWILSIMSVIFSSSQETLVLLIKVISIIFEISLPIFVYFKLKTNRSSKAMLLLTAFLLFNPGTIFNSSIWGQIDSILTFFLFLSVYYLSQNQLQKSSLSLGLKSASLAYSYSFLIKPQSLALSPLYLIDIIKNFSLQRIKNIILPGIILFFLLSLPFFLSDPIFGIFRLIFQMSQDYPATSLFAYNFWGIEGFWISDLQTIGPLTTRTIGTMLYILFIGFVIFLGVRKKANYFALATLLFLAFYFIPTRVHERYLYPAIPFLFIYAFIIRNKVLTALSTILSVLYFCSQYYVYVYYNEFYLKLEKILYQESFYSFLDTNGKLLSLISSIIFIMIVWIITKSIYAKPTTKT
jgi:dolichyl-phosphate-mannose-protein mannosyltransferase